MKFVLDIDDYPNNAEVSISILDSLHNEFSNFKCTMFCIPDLMTEKHWDMLVARKDWLKAGIHGFHHQKGEWRKLDKNTETYKKELFEVINNPLHRWNTPLIKAPWFGYCVDFLRAAHELERYPVLGQRDNIFPVIENNKIVSGTPDDFWNFTVVAKQDFSEKISWYLCAHTCGKCSIERGRIQNALKYRLSSPEYEMDLTENYLHPIFYKLNLGSSTHILDKWENLDPRDSLDPRIKKWEWNQRLPYADNSCFFILVQHSLMYCDKDKYQWNLKEMHRVLAPYGTLLIKEDNDLHGLWKPIGTVHATGTIRSSTNMNEFTNILNEAGFIVSEADKGTLINRYPDIINRQRKLWHDRVFAVECKKSEQI